MARPSRRARVATPQSTFLTVAPFYDLVNRCLSLGMDQRWRRRAAQEVEFGAGTRVLDLGTGTGAMAGALADCATTDVALVGLDLNLAMLEVASRERHGRCAMSLVCGDATRMPFRDCTFDAVTVAFALDDTGDREGAAWEIARAMRPGGRVVLLELSWPRHRFFVVAYRLYLYAVAILGRLVPRLSGFQQLRDEILCYRGRDSLGALLSGAGFASHRSLDLTGGVTTMHVAVKTGLSATVSPH